MLIQIKATEIDPGDKWEGDDAAGTITAVTDDSFTVLTEDDEERTYPLDEAGHLFFTELQF